MDRQGITSRRLLAAAMTALTAATTLAVTAAPASAATHRPCTVVKHSTTTGVAKVGTAGATVVTEGVKLTTSTTSDDDKVTWKDTFRPVLASTVTEVNYETEKLDKAGPGVNDSALPSYHLYVKTPAGEGTLVYEPYYYLNSLGISYPQRVIRTEWNVLDGLLWSPDNTITGVDPTHGGPAKKTFAEIVAANPKMVVTGIGFGLGTYNRGVISVLDDQRFATKTDCTEHQWSTGFKTGGWWPLWPWLH
jgi:hypothetical protein